MLEDPNAGGIGSVLNMQLVKVLEGPNNGDGGSLLNLQLVFFLECFLLLDKVGGRRGTCYTAQPDNYERSKVRDTLYTIYYTTITSFEGWH